MENQEKKRPPGSLSDWTILFSADLAPFFGNESWGRGREKPFKVLEGEFLLLFCRLFVFIHYTERALARDKRISLTLCESGRSISVLGVTPPTQEHPLGRTAARSVVEV